MKMLSLLSLDAVFPAMEARDKKHAFKMLAARAAALSGLAEKEIYNVLLDREHMGCTGMGNGVSIPHGRFEKLEAPLALFARLAHPVEFGAADGKRVDLVFLLLTPSGANTEHIKALAVISRILRDKQLCENIRNTQDAREVHHLLTADPSDIAI